MSERTADALEEAQAEIESLRRELRSRPYQGAFMRQQMANLGQEAVFEPQHHPPTALSFRTLPPYTIPDQDKDLLDIGVNFGTIATELQRCRKCRRLFIPSRMPGRDVRMRLGCDDCRAEEKCRPLPTHDRYGVPT